MMRGILFLVAAVALAGCTPMNTAPTPARETVTVTAGQESGGAGQESIAAPAPVGVYSGAGVFSVGDKPSGGAQQSIPPGRYTMTVNPGQTGGTLMRCNNILCGLEYPDHTITIENAEGADYSSVVEIQPTDAAIWIQLVTLTRVP
jgi:hypothetical protein